MEASSRRASSRSAPPDPGGWTRPALALLPLACVALGGGVERWSQALVLLALGGLLLAVPPRVSLGRVTNVILAALLGLGLVAFLPARWFPLPAWRRAFVDDFGAVLPGTLSAQPWLSLESWFVFLAGMSWLYLMGTVPWKPGERRRAGMIFAAGVAVLAGAFVLLGKLGMSIPIWENPRHFGPFPNRNQTANFLAIGALPVLALARSAWRGGRIAETLGWLVGWLVTAVAVFQCFSRAGIGILFVTTGVYLGVEFFRAARRPPATRNEAKFAPWRRVALLVSLVLVAASSFFAVGGDTLQRLRGGAAYTDVNTMSNTLRLQIQADALDMTASSPWTGVGLGNFASLFEIFRQRSADAPLRSIHPESDWLWLAAEMGWPALVLAVAGCLVLGSRMWPARNSHDRPLRTAAALGVAVFAVHGFFDVSAHRLGTALCGLFLAGLALPGQSDPAAPSQKRLSAFFRVLGGCFLAVGAFWLLAARGGLLVPGAQGAARLQARAQGQGAAHDFSGAQASATRALAWAPLDWELYFVRAAAGVYRKGESDNAEMDFRRARFLERCSPAAPFDEARLWAAAGQDALAVNALLEACRRAPSRASEFIGPVYAARPGDDELVDLLSGAVMRSPALQVALTEQLAGVDIRQFVARVISADPELARFDDGQKIRFFRAWASKGDPQALVTGMTVHPVWQMLGWRWWAEAQGRAETPEGWQAACGIAAFHAAKPDVPSTNDSRPIKELRREAAAVPDDPSLALALYRAQLAAAEPDAALATLHRMAEHPENPSYFAFLEAQVASDNGKWKTAWEAWQRYLAVSGTLH